MWAGNLKWNIRNINMYNNNNILIHYSLLINKINIDVLKRFSY